MFSKRNDKSGHIKEAEENQSERDLKKQNKGLQKGERILQEMQLGKNFKKTRIKGREG